MFMDPILNLTGEKVFRLALEAMYFEVLCITKGHFNFKLRENPATFSPRHNFLESLTLTSTSRSLSILDLLRRITTVQVRTCKYLGNSSTFKNRFYLQVPVD